MTGNFRMRRWAGLFALVGVVFGLGQVFAQGIPSGAFVRDSAGNIWLVSGGQRAAVPIYQTTDDQIAAIPDSSQWVVPAADGSGALVLGVRPSWAGGAPAAVAIPGDALPTVTIQVDDRSIVSGQKISITLIGADDKGLQWIEWEGTYFDDGEDNDNRSTGDAELDGRHRFDCDDQKQCANVWTSTPTKKGEFKLRARARDNAEQRSQWVNIDLRVR